LGERYEGQVIIRFRIFAVLAAAMLSACSALPGAGPDLFTTASVDDGVNGPRIIDIDARVMAALRSGKSPTLTSFSDYQAASAPVIGVGDIVRVNIWEAAPGNLFNATNSAGTVLVGSAGGTAIPDQVVQPGGTINVPFAGDIKVVGKQPREVEAAVVRKLSAKAVDPQALVSVSKSAANSVTVTGDAVSGGLVQLSPSNERILDAISMVGGIRTPINDTYVSLSRGGKVVTVPFLLLTTAAEENIRLSPRDVLSVYGHRRTYTILGAARAPSDIPFDAPIVTLAQALGRAGGLDDNKADSTSVLIFRYEPASLVSAIFGEPGGGSEPAPVIYRLNLRSTTGLFYAKGFLMRDGDVVFITNAPGAELAKFLSIVGTAVTPAVYGLDIYNVVK
jgi:polysaccharide export outer membrane protein